ncbi:response regulator [Paenibacillus sp. 598K]|uniref:response regulator n=1 Tax=Paenibacillus sp. 598K TaxID=1117987 RepID=UPI001C884903|nr:response regulator [Paenibacillus sp. 598K]
MRVILVDDEELPLKRLKRMLSVYADIQICGVFHNPAEALDYTAVHPVDAAFLDITMPGLSGLQLANRLRELRPALACVIVTGYDEYAVQAYDTDILDYVVKPVTEERLARTLQRLRRQLLADDQAHPLPQPQSQLQGTRLSIRLLGGLEISSGGSRREPVKLRSPKTLELLALLVCHRTISREEVADTLWRDLGPDKAWKNLNTTLYYIRRATSEGGLLPFLSTEGNMLHIDPAAVECDMYEFEALLQEAREIGDFSDDQLRRMDRLYREGGLLKGRMYEWATERARRLEHEYAAMLEAAARSKGTEPLRALQLYERLLQLDELREDIHREVIRLYVAMDRQSEARRQYRLLAQLLDRELGAPPDPELRQLLDS